MAANKRSGDTRDNNKARTGLSAALIVATAMIISGLSLSFLSLSFAQDSMVIAQATQPHTSPVPSGKQDGPAESKPGGARPTTPAPEPARPDADDARRANPEPALPPAPPEKVAPPIKGH